MANLETYFNNSQPLDEYIDSMTVNKDNVLTIYNAFTLLRLTIESINLKIVLILKSWL